MKLQPLVPEKVVPRQPDDYSMTYRGSSLQRNVSADFMRRCGPCCARAPRVAAPA